MNNNADHGNYLPFESMVDLGMDSGYPLAVVESSAAIGSVHLNFAIDKSITECKQAPLTRRTDSSNMQLLGQWLCDRVFAGNIGVFYHSSLVIAHNLGKLLKRRINSYYAVALT